MSGTRSDHETHVGDNPPTSEQLFRLAAQAMVASRARSSSPKPRIHYSIQETHYYNDAASLLYDNYPAQIRRRMAIRIARRAVNDIPIRQWSLKVFRYKLVRTAERHMGGGEEPVSV